MKSTKKTLSFPLFQKCSDFCKDEFWKQQLRDMSIGRMPKNILVINKTLVSSGRRSESLSLENYNSEEELCYRVVEFLQTNCFIFSSNDIKKKNILINQIRQNNDENRKLKWQQIRKLNVRKIFLLDFVYKNKVNYDLNWSQATTLYKLCEDFLTNKGSSRKIIFEDGEIQSIDGVTISPGGFEVQKFNEPCKSSKVSKKDTGWESYVREHLKHIYNELN